MPHNLWREVKHMLDEKDLQAIREMIQETTKQTLQDAMQGASVRMKSFFEPKFRLPVAS